MPVKSLLPHALFCETREVLVVVVCISNQISSMYIQKESS